MSEFGSPICHQKFDLPAEKIAKCRKLSEPVYNLANMKAWDFERICAKDIFNGKDTNTAY